MNDTAAGKVCPSRTSRKNAIRAVPTTAGAALMMLNSGNIPNQSIPVLPDHTYGAGIHAVRNRSLRFIHIFAGYMNLWRDMIKLFFFVNEINNYTTDGCYGTDYT